ncbi:MAG TPA: queuosine precursor transporter [Methanotrichaceae archaeon]|nr:queuosine precursor transporter [Methanotrichaceae archaeon]
MLEILLWIVAISAFTLFGSLYARKYNRADALIGLYVAFGVFSNIAATKTVEFNLGFASFYAPAVVLIFAVTFLLTDVVNEKFGIAETRGMILIAFVSQVIISFFSWLVLALPAAPFYTGQAALESVLGQVPRIALASWIAFLASENLDAFIYAWFKAKTGGRHLWARNAFSSIPAMALDSVLFITIAFYGVMPVVPLIMGQLVLKWLVAVIDIPFMYLNRWLMYRK